jgi:ABC-type Fe3+-siderophore transport system permease subunit
MAMAGAGGLSARTWTHLRTVLPYSLAAATVALLLARQIDVLALGDEPAMGLGLRVEWLRAGLIAIVAVLTGSAVAVAGLIGFVGLIVPHIARRLIGPRHGYLPAGERAFNRGACGGGGRGSAHRRRAA